MNEPLGIAILGCGTVGTGVAKLLLEQRERLAQRAGRPLVLRSVVVRDVQKERAVALPSGIVTTDPLVPFRDPLVHVVVELVGGTTSSKTLVLDALTAG